MGLDMHQPYRKPTYPSQQRRPEEEIEKAKPDGGQPINQPDGKIRKAKREQRRSHKAEGQHQHGRMQSGHGGGVESGHESDEGEKHQPMRGKKYDLND